MKRYSDLNPDELRVYKRDWARAHKQQKHEYYLAHKEEHLKRCAEYIKAHPEKKRAYVRKYQQSHREKINLSRKLRRRTHGDKWYTTNKNTPEFRAFKVRFNKQMREKFPEKYRARAMVTNALTSGKLKKAPCEKCGDLKVHAHHDDYSKPLEVRWLCRKHHDEHHQRIKHGPS